MLILNKDDLYQAISMSEMMKAIEKAYLVYRNNEYNMPLRTQVQHEKDTLLLMPCFSKNEYGTKMVNVFPENESLPVTQGLMVLNDIRNGQTKAIINGTTLTAMRTGALGGVAVDYLSSPDVKSVGLVGTGLQGLYQLIAAFEAREFTDIYLFNRTSDKVPSFIEKLNNNLKRKIKIHVVKSSKELVENSDVIMIATTSSEPVLPDQEDVLKGKTFIGIGSFQPNMREFSSALYKVLDHIYIDTNGAKQESGDIVQPLDREWIRESQIKPFANLVADGKRLAPSDKKSTVFKSTGMALFDVIASQMVYEKARQNDIGQQVDW